MILKCRYSFLLLDFVQRLTHILKQHFPEASIAFFFKQETPNLFDSLYQAIVSYCVPLKPLPSADKLLRTELARGLNMINPYPTAFPYGNGMVLHFYQQQESSTTKTVHKVINKRLKTYV